MQRMVFVGDNVAKTTLFYESNTLQSKLINLWPSLDYDKTTYSIILKIEGMAQKQYVANVLSSAKPHI